MLRSRRRGFTLVELLLVLALVGVLAGSVVLVSGGASDRAKAIRIVSDLRTIKSAALMYYVDRGRWPSRFEELLEGGYVSPTLGNFSIEGPGDDVVIFGPIEEMGVRRALESMAAEAGLIGGEDEDVADPSYPPYRADLHEFVGMRIR